MDKNFQGVLTKRFSLGGTLSTIFPPDNRANSTSGTLLTNATKYGCSPKQQKGGGEGGQFTLLFILHYIKNQF